MTFVKGQSGNPSGRPKADTASLRPLLNQHGADVLQIVFNAAKNGDMVACRLILERLYPAIKPQSLPVTIPMGESLPETGQNVIAETMKGNILYGFIRL